MLIHFLTRFAVPILLVLIFFFILFLVVFLFYRRSRRISEEDPMITTLENNNVDSFLRAINEIDGTDHGLIKPAHKQIEGDEDTIIQDVTMSDIPEDNSEGNAPEREDSEDETSEGRIKHAISSFLGGVGVSEQAAESEEEIVEKDPGITPEEGSEEDTGNKIDIEAEDEEKD